MKTAIAHPLHEGFHPLASLSATVGKWFHRARAVDALNELPDRYLRDIGIARGDIETVIDREVGRYRVR